MASYPKANPVIVQIVWRRPRVKPSGINVMWRAVAKNMPKLVIWGPIWDRTVPCCLLDVNGPDAERDFTELISWRATKEPIRARKGSCVMCVNGPFQGRTIWISIPSGTRLKKLLRRRPALPQAAIVKTPSQFRANQDNSYPYSHCLSLSLWVTILNDFTHISHYLSPISYILIIEQ